MASICLNAIVRRYTAAMNPSALPNPFTGLWLAHWCGLTGLAELPGQLLASDLYQAEAGTPMALAARMLSNAELLAQFVADWRPVLVAVADGGADWRVQLEQHGEALAQRLLQALEAQAALWQMTLPALPGIGGWGAALAALINAYLAVARLTLTGFITRLAQVLEQAPLTSHTTLIALWADAASVAHRQVLHAGLPEAYANTINEFDALFGALLAEARL